MPDRPSSVSLHRSFHWSDRVVASLGRVVAYGFLLALLAIMLKVFWGGFGALVQPEAPFINWRFFVEAPETLYVFTYEAEELRLGERAFRAWLEAAELTESAVDPRIYPLVGGGIGPALVGTLLLVLGAMALALPLAMAGSVFLSEYAGNGRAVRFVRWTIFNLAGIPSIVFGLFGFSLFVRFFDLGPSLAAGAATLAVMALPTLIIAGEEALRGVPRSLREGALALGATRWQTLRAIVLPRALPGFAATALMGMARIAGETAPILFTAAFALRPRWPWEVAQASDFFTQGVMALSYHMYIVAAKSPHNDDTAPMQYGTALVFLLFVMSLALASFVLRSYRKPGREVRPAASF